MNIMVIYMAGNFGRQNSLEIENNIRRTEEIALTVILVPFTDRARDRVWLDADLESLRDLKR